VLVAHFNSHLSNKESRSVVLSGDRWSRHWGEEEACGIATMLTGEEDDPPDKSGE
jgi:hypothetical protein